MTPPDLDPTKPFRINATMDLDTGEVTHHEPPQQLTSPDDLYPTAHAGGVPVAWCAGECDLCTYMKSQEARISALEADRALARVALDKLHHSCSWGGSGYLATGPMIAPSEWAVMHARKILGLTR